MDQDQEHSDDYGNGNQGGTGGREGRGNAGGGGGGEQRVKTFEDMKVWQEAHQLTIRIFEETPKLPSEQQEGLALRMEQAAVDVPRYIAEGFKRRGSRNKAHYYDIARTTLEGLRYYFILCRDLKYGLNFDDLAYRGDQVSRMLDGLVRSMARTARDGDGGGGRGGRGRGGRGGDRRGGGRDSRGGGGGGGRREGGVEPRSDMDYHDEDLGDDD